VHARSLRDDNSDPTPIEHVLRHVYSNVRASVGEDIAFVLVLTYDEVVSEYYLPIG